MQGCFQYQATAHFLLKKMKGDIYRDLLYKTKDKSIFLKASEKELNLTGILYKELKIEAQKDGVDHILYLMFNISCIREHWYEFYQKYFCKFSETLVCLLKVFIPKELLNMRYLVEMEPCPCWKQVCEDSIQL